jgi:GH15 family glucan-1,4-alpha-glucosidase
VGLLAEEIDPLTGRMLGNFPQAYSHVGLINCALTSVDRGAVQGHLKVGGLKSLGVEAT